MSEDALDGDAQSNADGVSQSRKENNNRTIQMKTIIYRHPPQWRVNGDRGNKNQFEGTKAEYENRVTWVIKKANFRES